MENDIMSLEQFKQQFHSEEACIAYFFQVKWPDGFSCPRCGYQHAYTTGTRRLPLYECRQCRHQTSLTAGTILEGSRTELRKWLLAFFLISRTERGTSAVELAREISVTYKTAWLMLHKIRHAINTADGQSLLSGIVRVNTAAYGRPYNPSFRNHPQEHPLLVGASVDDNAQYTLVKIKLISEQYWLKRQINRMGVEAFTLNHVAPDTKDIDIVTGRFDPKRFRQLLSFVSEASKWINSTFHGLGSKHLQSYMNEFTFRLNLKLCKKSIFPQLAKICVEARAITYLSLTTFPLS